MNCLIALSLAWSVADAGAAVEAEQVHALVRQLDDPRFAVREQAGEALRRAGPRVVPLLRAKLAEQPPLEVGRRLQGLIDHHTRPDWHARVEEAVAEAKRTGKPLLVVAMQPSGDDPDRWTVPNIDDARLAHFLKQHYVVVWHVDTMGALFQTVTPNGGLSINGGGSLQVYLCSPDGTVKQLQSSLPALDQLADQSGAARPLPEPAARPEDTTFQVTDGRAGQVIDIRAIQIRNIQDFQLNPKQQVQMVRWGYGGPVDPVGRSIVDVLNAQNQLQYLLRN